MRDQREPKKQNAFRLRKPGNEGIRRIPPEMVRRVGLILLLSEKLARRERDGPDEHSRTGILTPGLNLAPAFPHRSRDPVALGVCSPLQWRNRPRFTRGSLTSDCVLEDHPILGLTKNCRRSYACRLHPPSSICFFWNFGGAPHPFPEAVPLPSWPAFPVQPATGRHSPTCRLMASQIFRDHASSTRSSRPSINSRALGSVPE